MIRLPARVSVSVSLLSAVGICAACNLEPLKETKATGNDNLTDKGSSGGGAGGSGSDSDPDATKDQPSVGGCAFGEPNDDRDHATKLRFGQPLKKGCFTGTGDIDWYELEIPADPGGGFMQLTAKNITAGRYDIKVFGSDNEQILWSSADSQKADINLFVAVKGGSKIRFSVKPGYWSKDETFEYDIDAKYTKLADTFEPNDNREQAKPIAKNGTISAFFSAGYDTSELGSYDDWYAVDLVAGKATIKVEDIAEGYAKVSIHDENGEAMDTDYAGTRGANVGLPDVEITKTGKHYVVVSASSLDAEGSATAVPPHFTKPYKLTVSQ